MEELKNFKFTENHEWVLIDGGVATIGVTDYAQKELGDIVYLDIDTLNQVLNIDDIFGSVEAVKTVSDLYMPIGGKIIEINGLLEENPELINQSPYKDGWIIKVEMNNMVDNNKLLTIDQYQNHIGL